MCPRYVPEMSQKLVLLSIPPYSPAWGVGGVLRAMSGMGRIEGVRSENVVNTRDMGGS